MSTLLQSQMKTASKPSFTPVPSGLLQRKCACGGSAGLDGECEECRKKRLQRRVANGADPNTLASLESSFRHDFSKIRVNTKAEVLQSALDENAIGGTRKRCAACASGKGLCPKCAEEEKSKHQRLLMARPDRSVDQLVYQPGIYRASLFHNRCPKDGACPEDDLARHQGSGTTVCDRASGTMRITALTEHCAGDCVEQHEETHRRDDAECCSRVNLCLNSAGADAGRQAACNTAYDTWFNNSADNAECAAYTQEVICLTNFIRDNCDGNKRATTGAVIGGAIGGVLGGVGGFLLGGPVGAAAGAVGGAAVGAGIGFLAGRVSAECCRTLRDELTFATSQRDTHCAAAAPLPCPFRADGTII